MAKVDQIKEELALARLKLGALAAIYVALLGWLLSKLGDKHAVSLDELPLLSLALMALIVTTLVMAAIDVLMRREIRELGEL